MLISNSVVKEHLLKQGWYENRTVNIENYLKWYQKYGFTPSNIVTEFLENFGGLVLKIPCYRYRVRALPRFPDMDIHESIHIDPTFFITKDFSEHDVTDSVEYVRDIAKFFGMENIVPVGYNDDGTEHFMGTNGELISAYEGDAGMMGMSFEDAVLTILTKENTDFQCIW